MEGFADHEDDFTSKTEETVFVSEDNLANLALQNEGNELFETWFIVIHAASNIGNYSIGSGFFLDVVLLASEVFFLIVRGNSCVADSEFFIV